MDYIAAVVGNEVILNSDVNNTLEELNRTWETKNERLNECVVLTDLISEMTYVNAARRDSTIVIREDEVETLIDNQLNYFVEQMGSMDKVLQFYKSENEDLLRTELTKLNKNNKLSQEMKRDLTKNVKITPDEIQKYFKDHSPDNIPVIGTSLEILQLVINIKPSEKAKARATKKLGKIREDILKGASFSTKAILYSEDPGSSSKGGLYTISKDMPFAKTFKEEAFSLEEGEISKIFETEFGYHILKVDKILGTKRDVRHILVIPDIDANTIISAKEAMVKIKEEILSGKITFEEAVLRYSEEKETKSNKGYLINPITQSTRFELSNLSPGLYSEVSKLKSQQISDILFERSETGKSLYKIIMVKNKREEHKASFSEDYEKIRELALANKKQKLITNWLKKEMRQIPISITGKDYQHCKASF